MELNPLGSSESKNLAGKRELIFASRIYSVTKIDTANLKCEVDFRVWMQWNKLSSTDTWNPEVGVTFNVLNALAEPTIIDVAPAKLCSGATDDSAILHLDADKSRKSANQMVKNWRLRATIATPMDLRDFPSDVQSIVLKFRVPRVDEQGISAVTVAGCELGSSLGVEDNWNVAKFDHQINIGNPGKANFKPEYHVALVLHRRSNFYVKNVIIPIAMFGLINFAVFFLPVDDLTARYSILLTILLTLVAFRLSVASWMPILSYETALDKYNTSSIIIIFLSAIISVVSYVLPEHAGNVVNVVFGSVLFGLYCVLNLYGCWWLWRVARV